MFLIGNSNCKIGVAVLSPNVAIENEYPSSVLPVDGFASDLDKRNISNTK